MVLVATVRALKMHGGGPKVVAGKPLDSAYTDENLDLLRAGLGNLQHHIRNARQFGVPVVVAVNSFATDTPAEVELVRKAALEAGAEDAVVCTHWMEGGKGAVELAEAVVKACEKPSNFKFLYPLEFSIKQKIEIDLQGNLRRGWGGLLARSRGARSSSTPAWASTSCRCAWPRRTSA